MFPSLTSSFVSLAVMSSLLYLFYGHNNKILITLSLENGFSLKNNDCTPSPSPSQSQSHLLLYYHLEQPQSHLLYYHLEQNSKSNLLLGNSRCD